MPEDLSEVGLPGVAVGGAGVLLVVLGCVVVLLAARYRRENTQLRARVTELSMENDRWHEDFAAATGELTALRDGLHANCAYRGAPRAEAS
ncbi:hypothetical protein LWF15_16495 [Kineosporia rhizophila]|uniref:hypothetical protein n=1 Tax=Kineosporia TaxID=49184 RepID=UPI000B23EFDC|nr:MULTISPECIES: hypothetical protein [Kineosporia]MCE0537103.1 hypothetical protein [Kineosporia rhizophila]GLY16052.1 hypothetical protein Kisp01_30670 [Kineosporia sp. NBRC 101677]